MARCTDGWPEEALLFDRVGSELHALHMGGEITFEEIMARIGTESRKLGWPSDYCYNRLNKDPRSFKYHIFEWLGGGKYLYLGPCRGQTYAKPIFRMRQKVGEWKEGMPILDPDARK